MRGSRHNHHGGHSAPPTFPPGGPQGLTNLWRKQSHVAKLQMHLKLRTPREVSERKQVGDAESMVNEGRGASGHHGFFKGEGGEV